MHQNRPISLVSTLFYHFYFHPLAGLNCYPHSISTKSASGLTIWDLDLTTTRSIFALWRHGHGTDHKRRWEIGLWVIYQLSFCRSRSLRISRRTVFRQITYHIRWGLLHSVFHLGLFGWFTFHIGQRSTKNFEEQMPYKFHSAKFVTCWNVQVPTWPCLPTFHCCKMGVTQ